MCKHCPTPDITPFLPFVRKGVTFLDEHGPADWRDMIAPKKLDLGDGNDCVLGQVFGGYTRGQDKLGICEEFAATAGFTTPLLGFPDAPTEYDEHAWDRALTAAWRQVLTEDRQAVAA